MNDIKMFEKFSYTNIMKSMLERVPNTIDKREGSIIFDALAPAAYEIAEIYQNLRQLHLDTFVKTARNEYLDYRTEELGVDRFKRTKALKRGIFKSHSGDKIILEIGDRFSTIGKNSIIYKVIGEIENDYILECEIEGTIGNPYTGDLRIIGHNEDLKSAFMTELIKPARDNETDDDLLERYLLKVKETPFGGNFSQYKGWLLEIDGIGACQIYPTWKGGGTVLCYIITPDYELCSDEFIKIIKEKIDPEELTSQGMGIAPIGHEVTIKTPDEYMIELEITIEIDDGYNLDDVELDIRKSLEEYRKELNRNWGKEDSNGKYEINIIHSTIFTLVNTTEGVKDTKNVKIINGDLNLILEQSSDHSIIVKEFYSYIGT